VYLFPTLEKGEEDERDKEAGSSCTWRDKKEKRERRS